MKNLIDYILLEELGISNDVVTITSKVKSEIGKDYTQNSGVRDEDYRWLPLSTSEKILTFHRCISIKFESDTFLIKYYVVDDGINKNSTIQKYFRKYFSGFDIKANELKLFLIGDGKRIFWQKTDATLQHEIEHWYQQYRKGDDLINQSHLKKYNKYRDLVKSNDPIKQNIGLIYYYFEKIEHDAIMNGLYNMIMSTNSVSYVDKPENILKEYQHYKNINEIKKIIDSIEKDEVYKSVFVNALNDINKSFDSFIKVANKVINMYAKGFGRTLYKAKKDLDERYKNMIN